MTVIFRMILFLVSACTLTFVLRRIRKAQVQIEDAIFWILFSVTLVVLSIFPDISDFCSRLLGVYSTTNFLFVFFIFILLIKNFLLSIRISQLDSKFKALTQEIAIKENMNDK